jgi:hypothetical protein
MQTTTQTTAPTAQTVLTTKDILDSFTVGQGKTNDLDLNFKVSEKIALNNLTIRYQGSNVTFQSDEHLNAYFLNLFYNTLKSKSLADIDKLFKHINSGNYLTLNHRDNKPEINIVEQYAGIFDIIVYTSLIRVSSKSKLYSLLYNVSLDSNKLLIANGFKLHMPIVDDITFQVIGFNVELPPKTEA